MKSPHTELARIVDIVNRLALANPTVAFSLTHDGKGGLSLGRER